MLYSEMNRRWTQQPEPFTTCSMQQRRTVNNLVKGVMDFISGLHPDCMKLRIRVNISCPSIWSPQFGPGSWVESPMSFEEGVAFYPRTGYGDQTKRQLTALQQPPPRQAVRDRSPGLAGAKAAAFGLRMAGSRSQKTVLQDQTKERRKARINHPTSMI